MTLRDWLSAKWIAPHLVTADEVLAGLRVVDRDLKDASVEQLSADWRFSITQNAVMQIATIALAAEGYRVAGEQHHYRVIQSLSYTLALERGLVSYLETSRKKRNKANYATAGVASDKEADELLDAALKLKVNLNSWLASKHPHLITSPSR